MRKGKTKTPKAPKKPDLAIEVRNFGPISKGSISLKNLTVLIGPNNSGKSYIAMLVHAFASSYYQRFEPPDSTLNILRRMPTLDFLRIIEKKLPEIKIWLNSIPPNVKEIFNIPEEIALKIIDKLYKHYYEHNLKYKIEALYASHQAELIRINKNAFKIKIIYNVNDNVNDCELSLGQDSKAMKIKNTFNIGNIDYEITYDHTDEYRNNLSKQKIEEDRQFLVEHIINNYNDLIAERSKIPFTDYLPAGRTGILQCYSKLFGNVIENIVFSSSKKNDTDSMQGAVAEFLYNIYKMQNHKGPLYDMAVKFEQEIIQGEILIERTLPGSLPRIQYRFKETVIPIHRTSSTVSELAPIILYLKYLIEPGNILIIEEPEAHLHPENQRLMAKLLVRLIRAGVYVIITTHSDFLLDQLSNYLLLSTVPEEKRQPFDQELYLSIEELGAYVFQQDKTGGYQIREAEVDKENGISEEEFLKTTEFIFDDTMKIRDILRN